MQLKFCSVMVKDQDEALNFYTNILGLEKVTDISNGGFRWLTVKSSEGVEGVELLLEPMNFPPAIVFQKALYDAGVPATLFVTNNIKEEYDRLKNLGVKFRGEPQKMGPATTTLFEDTCGNLINLAQIGE